MKPKFKWRGEKDSEQGRAEFSIGSNLETFELPCFLEAHRIYELLDLAYAAGQADARREVQQQLRDMLARLA